MCGHDQTLTGGYKPEEGYNIHVYTGIAVVYCPQCGQKKLNKLDDSKIEF